MEMARWPIGFLMGNKNCCSWPSAMKNQLGKKGKK